MKRRAAITGIGVISPVGAGSDAFWQGLTSGKNAVTEVTSFSTEGFDTRVAGSISFDVHGALRWRGLAEFAFKEAVKDARIDASAINGINLGTVLGGILAGQEAWRAGIGALPAEYHLYSGADYLARKFGIKGPVNTVSTACASGTDAIGMAYRVIVWGKADVMIAGGADALSEFAFTGFNCLKAMTKTGKVKPFSKNRDGLALGEGACFLVLEELGRAQRRGARVYGLVTGYASRADAGHLTAPDREGRGLASAMEAALKEAGVKKPGYVNAHGTGTLYNDAMETKAIKLALGRGAYDTPVSSIKAMLGHSFGAGGALEAAACLLAIKYGCIPPTINYEEKDPDCDLDYVPNTARKAAIKNAVSLSAGFGGQNAAIVFEEAR
ncbi:MAG: beta-ketoacyl-[acyl-carrier-protein] synthase family protein [Deltaproteobacteria bacterium]|nr:beta-ketoacyl-[acyl-carrier-protein] synthase family protein [Deltaproteobacteria bacterium]